MKPWCYFTLSLLVFFLVIFTLCLIDYKLGYHWSLFSFTAAWPGGAASPERPSSPSSSRGMGTRSNVWAQRVPQVSRPLALWNQLLLNKVFPTLWTLTPNPQIQGLTSLVFQKPFNIRNGFLSIPSLLPQRISHSFREIDESFLSEFKYKFIFKTGLITKLQYVLCERICLYHRNHSC